MSSNLVPFLNLWAYWLTIGEGIKYEILSLTRKLLNTYCVTLDLSPNPCYTRYPTVVTLAWPPIRSSLKTRAVLSQGPPRDAPNI